MLAYYLHDLDPFIFHLTENFGPRWYGMAYVLAFVCGYALLLWLAKRRYADLRPAQVGDFITWAALFGVMLGGRLGYVLFYKPEMLREPLSIFQSLGRRNVEPRRDHRVGFVHALLCATA